LARGGGNVILKRYYPGLGFLSGVCFAASAASLVGLLLAGDLVGKVILAALLAGMAAVGGSLWVVKTVLEVGFHLQERMQEATRRGGSGGATHAEPAATADRPRD
jgi:hypothetical protein